MGGVIPIPDYQEFMLPLLRIAGDGQGALSRKDGETLPAWCPCQARCPKTVVYGQVPVRCDIGEDPLRGCHLAWCSTTRLIINVSHWHPPHGL